MKELPGDLWTPLSVAKVITTNGEIKADGTAVMGAGVALQAAQLWPDLPKLLAERLEHRRMNSFHRYEFSGNHVHCFVLPHDIRKAMRCVYLLTFPTKDFWRHRSYLTLIAQSASELAFAANLLDLETVLLPRPGCGNGGLNWPIVKDCLTNYLDARFTVIHKDSDVS